MALTQKPTITLANVDKNGLPMGYGAPIAPGYKKEVFSGKVIPQSQKTTITKVDPNSMVTPSITGKQPIQPPVSPPAGGQKVTRDEIIQSMASNFPKIKEALDTGKATPDEIYATSLKKFPKVAALHNSGQIDNTARVQQQFDATYHPTTVLDQIKAGDYKGAAIHEATNVGVGFAGAVEGTADIGNRLRNKIGLSSDTENKQYAVAKEAIGFGETQKINPEAYSIGKVAGETLTTMAATPGFGALKSYSTAGKIFIRGLEGGANTQASSFLTTGKAASVKDTLIGTALGATAGGIQGVTQKGGSLKQTENLIMPKMTPSEEALRAQQGLKKTTWFTGKSLTGATKQEKEAAALLQTKFRPRASISTNTNIAVKEIDREAKNLLKVVKGDKQTYTIKEMMARGKDIILPESAKGDTYLEKQFVNFKDLMKRQLEKQPKNGEGALLARQEFDAILKRDFPNLYTSDKYEALRGVVRQIREMPNGWINEKIGGDIVKGSLRKQSLLFMIRDNLAGKVEKTGSTRFSRWLQANPTKKTLLKYGAISTAIGGAGVLGIKLGRGAAPGGVDAGN